jgi:hypothetical protein
MKYFVIALCWIWDHVGAIFWIAAAIFIAYVCIWGYVYDSNVDWHPEVETYVGNSIDVRFHTMDGKPDDANPDTFSGRSPDGKAIIERLGYRITRTNYFPVGSDVVLGPYPGAWYTITKVTDTRLWVEKR